MTTQKTAIPEVLLFEPKVFLDHRGQFIETFRQNVYAEAGITVPFVQDNMSVSRRNVLRGLHYQNPKCQGKLVMVTQGDVLDVAVDIRLGSPTFGKWVAEILSADNHRQIYVPPGFAHGFLVLSEMAIVNYKCTEYYDAASEGSIRWNDPAIGIRWPSSDPVLGLKDAEAPLLSDVPTQRLTFPSP